jgi:hypothetical protein
MKNVDLEEIKKFVRTDKDKSDYEGLKLLVEAQDTGDFSKWKKFTLNRAHKNNLKDLKENRPVKYYFMWFCRIFLFPLWIVIIIDMSIKYLKKRKHG